MNSTGHGRLISLVFLTGALLAAPLAGQSAEGTLGISSELVDVLVGALALTDPASAGAPDTEQLLAVLVGDPLVAAVLREAGADGFAPIEGSSPWGASADRLQEMLSGEVPPWFTQAIQGTLELGLPVVTPLNVLLVLVETPDAETAAFLSEHGLVAADVAALARGTLAELGRQLG
jgi:hypothetical protein